MNVALLSDTHVPDREDDLPEPFRERIADADRVIHAGDFTDPEVLAEIRDLGDDLAAVHGNVDGPELELPFYDVCEAGAVSFVVTHAHVGVRSREDWLRTVADFAAQYAEPPRIGVGGHTHVVEDERFELHEAVDVDGPTVRTLNPGSATGADPADRATMMTAVVDGEDVDVTVHEA